MKLVIVTGMSGAGKSTAMKMMEDIGYFCVDNIPIALVSKFVQISSKGDVVSSKIALGMDIRSGKSLEVLDEVLDEIKGMGYKFKILYLDSSTSVLVKRYKETRRIHPLSTETNPRIEDGIQKEITYTTLQLSQQYK